VLGLDADQTRRLMSTAPAAYTATPHDLVVAAVAWAAHEVFDLSAVALDAEAPGRTSPDETLDLSRTVGWLAHSYPLVVLTNGIVSAVLVATKEAIRAIPGEGLGYALLSQFPETGLGGFSPHLRVRFDPDPGPEAPEEGAGPGAIVTSDWPLGDTVAAANRAGVPVSLTALARGGRLDLILDYATDRLDEATAWRFVVAVQDGLTGIIEHCAAQPTPLHTASDVGATGLDDATIAVLNAVADDPRDYA
jgi:non-ribosomal peptide synthase protein (TIGR01720 family)